MRSDVYCTSGEFFDNSHANLHEAGKIGWADWKENPNSVLEEVDRLLEPLGLEVVIFTIDGDDYRFSIWKRGENPTGTETTTLKS